jgi:hypothetical protein
MILMAHHQPALALVAALGLTSGASLAHAQLSYISESRSVSARASSSANGNTDSEGPVVVNGPSFGALWDSGNSALASTSVPRATAGASSTQLSSFSPREVRAQGSVSSTAIISSTASSGAISTQTESLCVFLFLLPANQRLEVIASQSGSGTVTLTNINTSQTLFSGSGVQTLQYASDAVIRFEGRAFAMLASTTIPTTTSGGGSYSVILNNLDAPLTPPCDDLDFNNNDLFPEDQDLIDFLNVLAGGPCSAGNTCNDIDFNNDGIFPSDEDLIAYLRVLGGAAC